MARMNPALSRALDILEALVASPQAPTLRDLVAELDIPRSSAFELTNTLVERGYVLKSDSEPTTFEIGPRAFELGSAFAARVDYVSLGATAAAELTATSNETTHVAILDGAQVVYIARAESAQKVRMVSSVGSRLPAHATAIGKALIAHLSDAEFDLLYPEGSALEGLTPNTITDTGRLREERARILDAGFAVEECESNDDVCCAAAPVRDREGRVIAAISASVPESRWTAQPQSHWAELVLAAAADYSAALGYVRA